MLETGGDQHCAKRINIIGFVGDKCLALLKVPGHRVGVNTVVHLCLGGIKFNRLPDTVDHGYDQQREISHAGRWTGESGVAARYRMMLFADGEEVFAGDIHSGEAPDQREVKRVRKGFNRKDVKKVLAKGGKLSFGETIRCKVRYFSDGMTLGSREFVDHVLQHHARCVVLGGSSPKRESTRCGN